MHVRAAAFYTHEVAPSSSFRSDIHVSRATGFQIIVYYGWFERPRALSP